MNFVFLSFNVSLFALNQTAAFLSSEFAKSNICSRSGPDTWNVVSSANKRVKNSVALGKSFIKIKNKSGPKTEPWGTPQVTLVLFDSTP